MNQKFDAHPAQRDKREDDFERAKIEFTAWVKNFIHNFYGTEPAGDDYEIAFGDPVRTKIDALIGEEGLITPEKKELTVVFGEELVSFCKNLIFDKNYDDKKADNFYQNLYQTFFNRSPDIFENLNIDYLQKIIMSSEISETYKLRDVVNAPGELAYDLSYAPQKTIEKIIEDIKKLRGSKKISAIKQLSSVAVNAFGDGSWAHPALVGIVNLLREIKKTDNSPLVSFVASFELIKIKNFMDKTNDPEGAEKEMYLYKRFAPEMIEDKTKIYKEDPSLSKKNKIIPSLNNILYIDVSKDYLGVVFSDSLIPFALIKKPEEVEKTQGFLPMKNYDDLEKEKEFNPMGIEDFSHLIKVLHTPEIKNFINLKLKIKIENLSLREQIHFLRFLSGQNKKDFNHLQTVLETHPNISNKILNSFLAVAEDMRYGESILKLAEGLDEKTAEAVFSKYLEIVNTTEHIRKLTEEQSGEVVKNLLHKGNELLKNWAESTDKQNSKPIVEQLEHIKAEVFLFASTFKVLSAKEKIDLTDLKGAYFEIKDSSVLTDEEKQPMLRIFAENRSGYPPGLFKETMGEFDRALQTQNHEFHILRFNNEIVAFLRFDKLPNGNLYAGSLNVRTEVRGSAIGTAMLHATLDKKAEEFNIEAVVYEKNPMLHRYIEDYGFEITGEEENYKDTGQKFYKIKIKKGRKNDQAPTSNASAFSHAA
jgi:predicted GNAT family N-acyltransferase